MKFIFTVTTVLLFFLVVLDFSDAWTGNFHIEIKSRSYRKSYCAIWYSWWGCYYWRWTTEYYYEYQCLPGWTHSGDQNCNIPICLPACQDGETCLLPNVCTDQVYLQDQGVLDVFPPKAVIPRTAKIGKTAS